jgi:hypothetical protein
MPYKMKHTLRPATDHQKKLEAEENEYWIKYGERTKIGLVQQRKRIDK